MTVTNLRHSRRESDTVRPAVLLLGFGHDNKQRRTPISLQSHTLNLTLNLLLLLLLLFVIPSSARNVRTNNGFFIMFSETA